MSDTKIPGSDTVIDETFGIAISQPPPPPPSPYKLVVGIDFDVTGDNAMAEALRLAETQGETEIHAVYVISHNIETIRASVLSKRNDELEDIPAKLHQHIETRFGDFVRKVAKLVLHVRVGEPAQALHQLAVDIDADMIIVEPTVAPACANGHLGPSPRRCSRSRTAPCSSRVLATTLAARKLRTPSHSAPIARELAPRATAKSSGAIGTHAPMSEHT
jgi:hypothetical protein